MAKEPKSIYEELYERKIELEYFNAVYFSLKEGEVPDVKQVPKEQYGRIMAYFGSLGVFNEKGVVDKRGLNLFKNRKTLEDMQFEPENLPDLDPRGGVAPCR